MAKIPRLNQPRQAPDGLQFISHNFQIGDRIRVSDLYGAVEGTLVGACVYQTSKFIQVNLGSTEVLLAHPDSPEGADYHYEAAA